MSDKRKKEKEQLDSYCDPIMATRCDGKCQGMAEICDGSKSNSEVLIDPFGGLEVADGAALPVGNYLFG